MTPTPRIMLLIDADNVSSDVIEQAAQRTMAVYGAIHVRRAYCNAETALKQQALFKRLSVRPMVNISAGKNSTDIALAVDAIDLVIAERPHVVVLVSSDSDFAPLVIRLREKGCRVLGIGQLGKTGEDSRGVYDGFVDMAHQKARVATRPAPGRSATRALAPALPAAVAAAVPVPAPQAAPTPAPARARARAQPVRARMPAAVPPAPAPALPPEVAAILHAFPALGNGSAMQLNEVGEAMRKHEILKSKSASPSGYLKRHKAHFELAPADKPRTVRYLGARPA